MPIDRDTTKWNGVGDPSDAAGLTRHSNDAIGQVAPLPLVSLSSDSDPDAVGPAQFGFSSESSSSLDFLLAVGSLIEPSPGFVFADSSADAISVS